MSTGKKVALSLFISILLFTLFLGISCITLFTTFETRFYQPAVISEMEKHLKAVSACLDEYTMKQASKFLTYVNLPCVKNAYSSFQSEKDINDRDYYAKGIVDLYSGLQGIRIIDSKGRKIIYSTYKDDSSIYSENGELPYDNIKSSELDENRSKAKIIFDNTQERIIYSFPFYDNYNLYRGSVVFYVAGYDFNNYLTAKNILSYSERATLVATVFSDSSEQSKGFVLGLPSVSSDVIISKIVDLWDKNSFETQKILHSEDYNWFVVSDNSGKTGIISLVFRDDILVFGTELKVLLLVCIFITLYLVVLFFFNIKQDDEAIISDKIKMFKIALINEYLLNSDDSNWEDVSKFLAIRKHQINHEIKTLLGQKAETHKVLVDSLLENTWNDVEKVIIYHEKVNINENKNIPVSEEIDDVEYLPEIIDVDENTKDDVSEDEEYSKVEIIEVIDDAEEVEYVDDSERNYKEWGDDEDFSTSDDDKFSSEEVSTLPSFHFTKDNTASIGDLNFEFSRPDFGSLDSDEGEEVEELTDDLEPVEEVNELEDIGNQIEDEEELEEIAPVDEAEEVEEVAEDIEEIEELEEINGDFDSVEEIEQLEEITEIEEIEKFEETPEAELEELNYVEVFSFSSGINGNLFHSEKIEELYPVDEDNPIIETETGLFVISDNIDTKKLSLDQNFQNLVDSVLQNTI